MFFLAVSLKLINSYLTGREIDLLSLGGTDSQFVSILKLKKIRLVYGVTALKKRIRTSIKMKLNKSDGQTNTRNAKFEIDRINLTIRDIRYGQINPKCRHVLKKKVLSRLICILYTDFLI